MSYYALGLVVVVEADDAESAFEQVNPPRDESKETGLSADGDAYVGVVFSGPACPITPAMAADPDWTVNVYYHASEMEIATGLALPLMDGDE